MTFDGKPLDGVFVMHMHGRRLSVRRACSPPDLKTVSTIVTDNLTGSIKVVRTVFELTERLDST